MTTDSVAAVAAQGPNSLLELSKNMPELLQKSEAALASATAAVKQLKPVTDEPTKTAAFELMSKIRDAANAYKELRMPFTRGLNAIIKRFTANEAGFLELAQQIQTGLDAYAKAELAKARAAQAQAEAELKAEQHRIKAAALVDGEIHARIDAALEKVRAYCIKLIQEVNTENYDQTKAKLSSDPKWSAQLHDSVFAVPGFCAFDDVAAEYWRSSILQQDQKKEDIKASYLRQAKTIIEDHLGLLDTALASKKEALALAELEQQKQKLEQEQRKIEEQARVEAETALAQLDAEPVPVTTKAQVKLKIQITSAQGWLQVIGFWFANDPDAKTKDLSKKTFLQCKTFAERMANTTGLMITGEDIGLVYVEDVKAKK